jgi:hypothetical protein
LQRRRPYSESDHILNIAYNVMCGGMVLDDIEVRRFVQRLILVPAQILRTGRRLVYRLLAWRPDLPVRFRFLDAL